MRTPVQGRKWRKQIAIITYVDREWRNGKKKMIAHVCRSSQPTTTARPSVIISLIYPPLQFSAPYSENRGRLQNYLIPTIVDPLTIIDQWRTETRKNMTVFVKVLLANKCIMKKERAAAMIDDMERSSDEGQVTVKASLMELEK